jgi:hypothetical protein
MFEDDLIQAIRLSKIGKRMDARKILEVIVHDDPKDEIAWLWLANTYNDNPNRIAVLEECLEHNPENKTTQNWLVTLYKEEARKAHDKKE